MVTYSTTDSMPFELSESSCALLGDSKVLQGRRKAFLADDTANPSPEELLANAVYGQQYATSKTSALMERLSEENLVLDKENKMLRRKINEMRKSALSPVSLAVFHYGSTFLRTKSRKKMNFKVKLEEGVYLIEVKKYSIFAYSETREGLISELCEELVFLWHAYAKETWMPISPTAKKIGARILRDFEEI